MNLEGSHISDHLKEIFYSQIKSCLKYNKRLNFLCFNGWKTLLKIFLSLLLYYFSCVLKIYTKLLLRVGAVYQNKKIVGETSPLENHPFYSL